jgi:hypothetical protein
MKTIIAVFTMLSALLCASSVVAQESRGTISGAVYDPAGAGVPGAKITVTEVRTGVKTASTSDSAGQYVAPFLPPGDYQVQAEVPGFKGFVRRGIHLASSDHAVIDITLQIGQVNQTVEVTAQAPLIDSANSSVGQSITTKEVEDFPLNGRNPIMVTQLAIGVIATGNPTLVHPFDNGAAAAWSLGGTPSQTADIIIDGAPDATWDNRLAYAPPQDAVQEVKVKAFDTDASYGHTGSGTINQVMKTGTNQLHGSAYWFGQPSALAANNFFSNRSGIPSQDTKFDQYGFTAGGPVFLPKIYNGRNKLFWFVAWEKLSDSQPNNKFLTVPTAAERQADFSGLDQIYNPYSGVVSGNNVSRKPFMCDAAGNPLTPKLTPGSGFGTQANGTPCNKLPQQLLNPVALAYVQFYPQPVSGLGSSTGFANFANSTATTDDYDNQLGRLDWAMSDRSRLAFNIRHNTESQSKNDYFGNKAHGLASLLTRVNWGGTVDEVYTLNSTTVLDARVNYTRLDERHPSPTAGFDPTTLGFPSYVSSTSDYLQLPHIVFGNCGNDTTPATSFECLGQTGANLLPSESYSIFGDVVKQWSKHTLKFGVDARRYKLDAQSYLQSVGEYSFTMSNGTGWTNGPLSNSPAGKFGQDFAAFLLGLPVAGTYNLAARGDYVENYYALFVNDDWRIRHNLTINLGLRFDRDLPYAEKLGRTVNGFDFTSTNPLANAATAAYNSKTASKMPFPVNFAVPGGLTFASPSDGAIWDNTSHLVSPRVGFAWSPGMFHDKTVIRGGFGLFVQPIALSDLAPTGSYSSSPILTQEGFSAATPFPVPGGNLLLPITTLSDPFSSGITQPGGSAGGLTTFLGQNVDFFSHSMKNPYSERWTLGMQHAITPNLMLEVVYIGNHALHLPVSVTQLNGIPRQYLSTLAYRDTAKINQLTASVPNPFVGLIPSLGTGGLNSATTTVRQLLTPFPEFPVADSTSFSSGVTERSAPLGSSYFNSLNVRVQKRFSSGLQFVENFIFSKLIERDSWLNNTDPFLEKRISPFDHSFRFVTGVSYDLPIGKGKRLNVESRWLDSIVGGWNVNGIYTYQTGAPLLWMNNSTNNSLDYPFCSVATVKGVCPLGTNGIPQAATSLPASLLLNNRQVDGTAFDISHFVTDSGQQFQFHLRTFPTTFSNVRQDGQNNFDAAIIKNIHFTERAYLQARLEAFNVLNHPTFGSPNMQVTSSQFGVISTQANRPRQLQIGVRFVF